MYIEALLVALLALPARAADPEAQAALDDALDPPSVAYEGRLETARGTGDKAEHTMLQVRYAPPRLYRRETLDRFGTPELTVVSDGETEWTYDRRTATVWRGPAPEAEGGLGDPAEERALLADNYIVRLEGEGRVAGRECRRLVLLPRRGGPPAQRLCVDSEHGLPLERVYYGEGGAELSRMAYQTVAFGVPHRPESFRFRAPAGTKVVKTRPAPDALDLSEAAEASGLTPLLPAWVPAGYVFEDVSLLPYHGAVLLHYRWSDGVDALSLFQAPPRLSIRPASAGAARPVKVGDAEARLTLLPGARSLEWTAGDRFVLVGGLPLDELRRVASSLTAGAP